MTELPFKEPARERAEPHLTIGSRVRTGLQDGGDWAPDTLRDRKDGARGSVEQASDAHGSCYFVRHDDGSSAWYNPTELAQDDVVDPIEIDHAVRAAREERVDKMARILAIGGCHLDFDALSAQAKAEYRALAGFVLTDNGWAELQRARAL